MANTKQKYRECVVFEREHIPPEYLPIGDIHDSETTVHRYLVKQCAAGNARRFRIGRLLFVHEDDIAAARNRYEDRATVEPRRPDRSDLQYESMCESMADIAQSLAGVERLLERLATAAEQIAKHPLARLEDVGIVETSSNGFHE
jgi:hypothetical protein